MKMSLFTPYRATTMRTQQQVMESPMSLANLISAKIAPASRTLCKTAVAFAAMAAMAGCGLSSSSNTADSGVGAAAAQHYSGSVFGGQQPVSGATVQLYTVGTTGLKSAATAIGTPVTTDANGMFNITGTYNCSGATQVYLLASGGNAGAGNNSAIRAAAALGSCTTLLNNAATTFININELTTVAAAYALAPFASDSLHIGASGSSPAGLVNAFANAQALVNIPTGTAGGASLPAGATLPTTEINTLGNIAAVCVNSSGAGSAGCSNLFTATGASNTFDALLAIAKSPGASAITALYATASPTSPFQPTLTSQPTDFSVAIRYNASGALATPYAIAIDAAGDAWIANASGTSVTELSPSGSVSASGTAPGLFGPQGVALDRAGNVWVANTGGNSLIKLTLTAGSITGTASYTVGGISAPTALAIDSGNNVFAANFNGGSVTGLSSAGTPISGSPFTANGLLSSPSSIAVGTDGSVYVSSSGGFAVKLAGATQASPGSYQSTITDSTLQGAGALALDRSNDLVITGYTTGGAVAGAVSEFSAAGAQALSAPLAAISNPSGVAYDGSSFWVANAATGGSLANLNYGSATAASPAGGFGSLNQPQGVAVDSTGSVWTANSGDNTVSRFIGLANPVLTPLSANVGP